MAKKVQPFASKKITATPQIDCDVLTLEQTALFHNKLFIMDANNVPSLNKNLCDIQYSTIRELGRILSRDTEKLNDLKGCPDHLQGSHYKTYCLDDLVAAEIKTGEKLMAHWGNRGMTVQTLIHFLEELQFERALKCIKSYECVRLIDQSETYHPIEEGDYLVLECKATGFPFPDYEWYKIENGKHPTKLSVKHNDGRFEIKNAKVQDAGTYVCKIHNNQLGNDRKLIKLYSNYFEVKVDPCTKVYKPQPPNYPLSEQGAQNIPGRPLITLQPEELVTIYMGEELRLSCRAIGSENLKYYWHKNDTLIGYEGPELIIGPTTLMDSAKYHCSIRNTQGKEVKTNVSLVKVFPQMQHWVAKRPRIVKQPTNKKDQIGGKVVFEVVAEGVGAIYYKWFKDGKQVPGETSSHLQIEIKSKAQAGSYQCLVSNEDKECEMSRVVTLQLEGTAIQYTAQDKVALIMGVSEYKHQTNLKSIKNDVSVVTKEFTALGFKVVSLLDLTLEEMHNAVKLFISLLDAGVYAIVYIAGHGFTHVGKHYFIPWDAPVQVQPIEALCIEEIENRIQEKRPAMLLIFLDICRKESKNINKDSSITNYWEQPKEFLGNRTIFFAASYLEKAYSVEPIKKDCSSTQPWGSLPNRSIFSQILMHVIWQDLTIPELWIEYIKAHKEHYRNDIQHPEVQSNLTEPGRKLTDPIFYEENTAAMNQRSRRWQTAHHVPPTSLYKVENLDQFEVCYDVVASNILEVNFVPHFNKAISKWKVTFAENKIPNEIKPIKFIALNEEQNENNYSDMCTLSYRINSLQRLKRPLKLEIHIAFEMILGAGDDPLRCECPPVLLDLGQPLISFVTSQPMYSYKEPEEQEESETEDK